MDTSITNSSQPKDVKQVKEMKKLIEKILENPVEANVAKVVNSLSNSELRPIYFELYNADISKLPKLKAAVVYCCMKSVLLKWTGYFSSDCDIDTIHQRLKEYVLNNLEYVFSVYDENEAKCVKEENNVNNKTSVELSCPFRQLKSVVFFDVSKTTQTIVNYTVIPKPIRNTSGVVDLVKDVFNTPHIEIKINCPSFIISKQNLHRSEFRFVRLNAQYKLQVKRLDTRLKYSKTMKTGADVFPSSFIKDFMLQLTQSIQADSVMTANKKADLLSVLAEFSYEIAKCTNEIEACTDYYSYIQKYPYVRYLGQKDPDTKPPIEYKGQVELIDSALNLRLEEVIHPCVKFCLSKFNISFKYDENGKYKFDFSEDFIAMLINKYLVFKCNLCHIEKTGQFAKYEIEIHIFEEHGREPNWYCIKCKKEFPMKTLCSQRWSHTCPYIVEKMNRSKKAKRSSSTSSKKT